MAESRMGDEEACLDLTLEKREAKNQRSRTSQQVFSVTTDTRGSIAQM